VPNAIDVTVASALDGDDPDSIAQLVANLRYGYGHTPAATSLPAPLSFESKARDYMTRFGLDEADAEDTPADGGDDGSIAAEPQADAAVGVSNSRRRRARRTTEVPGQKVAPSRLSEISSRH
jgi:hypothetical protein